VRRMAAPGSNTRAERRSKAARPRSMRAGSPEVAEFMRDVQQQNLKLAQQAKELLMQQEQV